ncbi:MAG: hypothetical protein B6D72_08050 [gamma proteobacterium symbiont of Ctena orbiculata]|uniref:DUF3299 domain-containing protein n=1 Tax=Candidatus Thiodiazotropha taylori TaxID=2792791 RepID=A0A944M9F2_9GAMM|nr:DUF3299 domain-containing protein [Candidatus Thiodiazotropha taylori]PUB87233.1 MAG: DUF3299 domain-containing protein [gamma proteobacterium symbiont of Ctena orbiculata]MBT2989242.1 DUF3299 domain-containing protein [Candidatus Thiodiazotropha taylori]MBT2995547.1 DUF3299 domain-containing protein [Candidatus Thiodiazotropha taylori]MBT2999499.1 DUF3299 domain-containing protein [Candidatus Thiodiazotropha taylori]
MKFRVAVLLVIPLLSLTPVYAEPFQELEWDAMIPEDYRPDKIMAQFGDINALEDDDPRAQKILDELEAAWKEAPVVESLDGKRIKLPGFVVPIEGDGKKLTEFLLVPYYGACIHVPPPPANQTVYVKVPKGDAKIREAFDTVWVSGILSAKSFDSDLATAGYQIEAEEVTPYE